MPGRAVDVQRFGQGKSLVGGLLAGDWRNNLSAGAALPALFLLLDCQEQEEQEKNPDHDAQAARLKGRPGCKRKARRLAALADSLAGHSASTAN